MSREGVNIIGGRYRYFLSTIIALAFLFGPAGAGTVLSGGTGARPISLGNAYTGFSDDGAGLFVNPAGLTSLKFPNLTSTYAQPAKNTNFAVLGGAFPSLFGFVVGAGFRNMTTSNIQVSNEVLSFTNQEVLFSLARNIRENLSLGAEVKQISQGLSKVISGYEGANGSGNAYGLFCKYSPWPYLGIGLSYQDLNGKINFLSGKTREIPSTLILGTSTGIIGKNALFQSQDQEGRLNLDVSQEKNKPLLLRSGLEWWPQEYLALRFGFDQSPKSTSETYTHFTAGVGLKLSGITIDYALYRMGDPSETITHYISLGYVGRKEGVRGPRRKPELLHFTDVPPGYWAKKPIEKLASLGIINYNPDGTFQPDRPVTRAEMVMFLVRAKEYELPKEKKQVFPDVPADFWAADYVQTAYEKKLTRGYPDGTFKPRNATTRAEEAIFLVRFDGLAPKEAVEKPYPDLPARHWSIKEVLAAKEEGILEYLKNNPFLPAQGLTRAELAETLSRTRLIKQLFKETGLE